MGVFVYKNVAYNKQTAFGASIGVGSVFLPVRTFNLNKDPEATIVEQTTNTAKGFRRAVNIKDKVEGEATFFPDFVNIGYWLGLAWGGSIGAATLGNSASTYTFYQNTTGNANTGRFDQDKQGFLEGFQDVFATQFDLTASDGQVEGTITLSGSRQIQGGTFTPSVTESRVMTFANAKWFYSDSLGVAGATMELPVTNWSISYKPGFEGKYQSGTNVISRQDSMMPHFELTLNRFFDGASGPIAMRDNVYGEDRERGMILDLTSDTDDLIAGVTQFRLRLPLPKVKLMTDERPYEVGTQVVEAIKGEALVEDAAGYMCEPQLISLLGLTF